MKIIRSMVVSVLAASLSATALAAGNPCESAAHRAFDFWLGNWEVTKPDGKLAGQNKIERKHGGCVLHEHYTTPSGYSGESLNGYDAARKRWQQTWMDNSGTVLLLDGGMQGKSMVLEGAGLDAQGKPIQHRITWTPNADGSVRQHWQSTDAKGVWTTAFDGLYKPRNGD